jgi:predicted HAD superfamily Cof-like phosphohydrolase
MEWRCHMTSEEAGEVADELLTEGWIDEAAVLGEAVDLAYITVGNLVTTGQMFARRWPIPSSLTLLRPLEFRTCARTMSFLLSVQADRVVRAWRERDREGWQEENNSLFHLVRCLFFAVGLPFAPFWQEVHRANMQKVPGLLRRKEQPQGWLAPDTARILTGLRQHD